MENFKELLKQELDKVKNFVRNKQDALRQEADAIIDNIGQLKSQLEDNIAEQHETVYMLEDVMREIVTEHEDRLAYISDYEDLVAGIDEVFVDSDLCEDEDEDEEEEDSRDDCIGYCNNCGCAIYEQDDHIDNAEGLFCDEYCLKDYQQESNEEEA